MFEHPQLLGGLATLPFILWLVWRRRDPIVTYTNIEGTRDLPRSWRMNWMWLPSALQLVTIALIWVALAQPRGGATRVEQDVEGIAISLVVDCSSSMYAQDFRLDEQRVDRLTAIKYVARQFVLGGGRLAGRPHDLIGLITFAGFADNQSALTLDHNFVVDRLLSAQIVDRREEDGTAIGDALALAVERLQAMADEPKSPSVTSKIIILLTDGENTAGDLDPRSAAELAKTWGIKIYTIGVGTQGEAPLPMVDPFSGKTVLRMVPVSIDEETLRNIADLTGGEYFRATDTQTLTKIYDEIDRLEQSAIDGQVLWDYRQWAIEWMTWQGWPLPPLLGAAVICLILRIGLEQTVLRRN